VMLPDQADNLGFVDSARNVSVSNPLDSGISVLGNAFDSLIGAGLAEGSSNGSDLG
jgi:hypothetical protein